MLLLYPPQVLFLTVFFFLLTQQIRERVKSMLHQAEMLIAKSCYHGDGIRQWATAVEKRYKDFSRRMKKYRIKLENKLGYSGTEQEVCTYYYWVSRGMRTSL